MFCDWVEYLDLISGEIIRLNAEACDFGYRESVFKGALQDKAVILTVGLKLKKDWLPNLEYGPLRKFDSHVFPQEIFDEVCQIRMSKLPDPVKLGNAGSFFKNPIVSNARFQQLQYQFTDIVGYPVDELQTKLAAGWLIDNAGLKGYRVGGAAVHLQQALVLVNIEHATGKDVCKLAERIIKVIEDRFSITLEVEPRIIGATGRIRV